MSKTEGFVALSNDEWTKLIAQYLTNKTTKK